MNQPFTTASYKAFLSEGRLMASRCARCGGLHSPPRAICPACHSSDMRWEELPTSGALAAFTCVYVAPSALARMGFGKDKPYCAGVVEVSPGVRVNARIAGVDALRPETIQIGTPLVIDWSATSPDHVTFAAREGSDLPGEPVAGDRHE